MNWLRKSATAAHLGVTEAGTERTGLLKSAAGISALLLRGIGDTIRIRQPTLCEVEAGLELRALGREIPRHNSLVSDLRAHKIDLFKIVGEVEKRLANIKAD